MTIPHRSSAPPHFLYNSQILVYSISLLNSIQLEKNSNQMECVFQVYRCLCCLCCSPCYAEPNSLLYKNKNKIITTFRSTLPHPIISSFSIFVRLQYKFFFNRLNQPVMVGISIVILFDHQPSFNVT